MEVCSATWLQPVDSLFMLRYATTVPHGCCLWMTLLCGGKQCHMAAACGGPCCAEVCHYSATWLQPVEDLVIVWRYAITVPHGCNLWRALLCRGMPLQCHMAEACGGPCYCVEVCHYSATWLQPVEGLVVQRYATTVPHGYSLWRAFCAEVCYYSATWLQPVEGLAVVQRYATTVPHGCSLWRALLWCGGMPLQCHMAAAYGGPCCGVEVCHHGTQK